jgi:hypothetical protein
MSDQATSTSSGADPTLKGKGKSVQQPEDDSMGEGESSESEVEDVSLARTCNWKFRALTITRSQ